MNKYEATKLLERIAKEKFQETGSKEDFDTWRELTHERMDLHDEIMIGRGLLLRGHTHPELTDTFLRRVLANELMVLRRSMHTVGESMTSDHVYGVRTGLDTFARRINDIQRRGMELVYKRPQG